MPKIFAIEGEWEASPKSKLSVLPALELLNSVKSFPFAYRTAATKQEFYHHLETAARNSSYNTIYLTFHGTDEGLWFSKGSLKLVDVGKKFKDEFCDRNILISSCQTGKNPKILEAFKKSTGAQAVAAYSKDVDFFESLLLDIACLEALDRLDKEKKWKTIIESEHSWLVEKTGLVVV